MSNKLFAIEKHGVYMVYVCGIFAEKELAIGVAEMLASKERDAYHVFAVVPMTLNQTYFNDVEGEKPIFRVNKERVLANDE